GAIASETASGSEKRHPESCSGPSAAQLPEALPSAPGAPAEPEAPPPAEIEHDDKLERDQQANRLQAHAQEPRDPAWAREMEGKLRAAFDELGRDGVLRYSEVECRYLSCKAKIEWPDSKAAHRQIKEVAILARQPLPCARYVVMDAPVPGRAEQTASILVDCQQARLDP